MGQAHLASWKRKLRARLRPPPAPCFLAGLPRETILDINDRLDAQASAAFAVTCKGVYELMREYNKIPKLHGADLCAFLYLLADDSLWNIYVCARCIRLHRYRHPPLFPPSQSPSRSVVREYLASKGLLPTGVDGKDCLTNALRDQLRLAMEHHIYGGRLGLSFGTIAINYQRSRHMLVDDSGKASGVYWEREVSANVVDGELILRTCHTLYGRTNGKNMVHVRQLVSHRANSHWFCPHLRLSCSSAYKHFVLDRDGGTVIKDGHPTIHRCYEERSCRACKTDLILRDPSRPQLVKWARWPWPGRLGRPLLPLLAVTAFQQPGDCKMTEECGKQSWKWGISGPVPNGATISRPHEDFGSISTKWTTAQRKPVWLSRWTYK